MMMVMMMVVMMVMVMMRKMTITMMMMFLSRESCRSRAAWLTGGVAVVLLVALVLTILGHAFCTSFRA